MTGEPRPIYKAGVINYKEKRPFKTISGSVIKKKNHLRVRPISRGHVRWGRGYLNLFQRHDVELERDG